MVQGRLRYGLKRNSIDNGRLRSTLGYGEGEGKRKGAVKVGEKEMKTRVPCETFSWCWGSY